MDYGIRFADELVGHRISRGSMDGHDKPCAVAQ